MQTISEKIIGNLPAPATGNKLHYFSGATLQGKKAPAGFAVRITAAGTRSFVLFHRTNGPIGRRWGAGTPTRRAERSRCATRS